MDDRFRLTGIVPPYYISEYLLNNHGCDVPGKRTGTVKYIAIAGAPVPETKISDDPAKEHIRGIDAGGLLPHYIVGSRGTWQILDLDDCWQQSGGNVNAESVCIAPILCSGLGGGYMYTFVAIHDIAVISAFLLNKYKLTEKDIKVTKECSPFIREHWKDFITQTRQWMRKI
jgi:hypothetical protein